MQRVLDKYDAQYFQCPHCDLIQTEPPYWLDEAPWSSIAHFDTGAVLRQSECVLVARAVAHVFGFDPSSRGLDFGAGSGLFVRSMRDCGFDFQWWDLYASNVYAKGFEGNPNETYDFVTAFEIFEHLPNVGEALGAILGRRNDVVLVGTVLHNGHQPGWWYYVPELGGHVSFYSARTMQFIAEQWGYEVLATPTYTVFYRRILSRRMQRILGRVITSARTRQLLLALGPTYEGLVRRDYGTLLSDFLPSVRPAIEADEPIIGPGPREREQRELALRVVGLINGPMERMLDRASATARRGIGFAEHVVASVFGMIATSASRS